MRLEPLMFTLQFSNMESGHVFFLILHIILRNYLMLSPFRCTTKHLLHNFHRNTIDPDSFVEVENVLEM